MVEEGVSSTAKGPVFINMCGGCFDHNADREELSLQKVDDKVIASDTVGWGKH